METIEIQCGNCNEMMAILVEHLGTQVHCPHCQAVVQTPDADSVAEDASAAHLDNETPVAQPASDEHIESIFAEPERDDLFDTETPQPRIEMPDSASRFDDDMPLQREREERLEKVLPDLSLEKLQSESYKVEPAQQVLQGSAMAAPLETHAPSLADQMGMHDDTSVSIGPKVQPRKRSLLLPTLLIFLVPYSITATIFVVLLMVNRGSTTQEDPMQRIPDPDPNPKGKKGPPRKLVTRHPHDAPLPGNLVTTLGRPVRIGDIEVTPLEVRQSHAGNLSLRFKARNLSKDLAFVPISKRFLEVFDKADIGKPYTFLHSQDKVHRVYGGYLEYQKANGEPDLRSDGELLPGQEETIEVTTLDKFKEAGARVLSSGARCMWRIQVRRGPVEVEGHANPLSATAVIGVDFAPADVIRSRREG